MNNTTNQAVVLQNTNQLSTGLQILVMLGAILISSISVLSYSIYVKIVYSDKTLMAISFYRISIFSAFSDMSQMILITALITMLTLLPVIFRLY